MTVTACKKDKHQQKYLKSEQFLDEKDTEKVMSSINQGLGRAMPLSSWGLWKLRSWFEGNRLSHDIIYMLMPHQHLLKRSEKCAARI